MEGGGVRREAGHVGRRSTLGGGVHREVGHTGRRSTLEGVRKQGGGVCREVGHTGEWRAAKVTRNKPQVKAGEGKMACGCADVQL